MYKRMRFVLFMALSLMLAACPMETDDTGGVPVSNPEPPGENPENPGTTPDTPPIEPPPPPAPALAEGSPQTRYDEETGAVSVVFTFNMDVTLASGGGWNSTGDGTDTITASPPSPVPGVPATVSITVGNKEHPERETSVSASGIMPVGGVFERPGSETEYTVSYYDENGAAGLVPADPQSGSLLGPDYVYVADPYFKNLFGAAAANEEPLRGLFHIVLGASEPDSDSIVIKGEYPPAGTAVINVGKPEGGNGGLPRFFIPFRQLGTSGGDYSGLKIQVNSGARLVILADPQDNAAYDPDAGQPCTPGYLLNSTVEVIGGGSLRIGAYEGFPLGEGLVIRMGLGSRLAVGPPDTADPYYSGWLIGPGEDSPRVEWGTGDQNGPYIEIRAGKIALFANVTVKKTLVLRHSVWFHNGPTLTIDAAGNDSLAIDGNKGLFARSGEYKFYGTKYNAGGLVIADVEARIVLKPGSALRRSFLVDEPEDAPVNAEVIKAEGDRKDIPHIGSEGKTPEVYSYSIYGSLNWNIPDVTGGEGNAD